MDQWPDETLGWAADIEKHLLEMQSNNTAEIPVVEIELDEHTEHNQHHGGDTDLALASHSGISRV